MYPPQYGQVRTPDITVLLAPTNICTFTSTFANNYLSTPTTVYTRKWTRLPNWTYPPINRPQTFTLVFMFDVPYAHTGQNALMWEIVVENGSAMDGYPQDLVTTASTVEGDRTTLQAGCTTPNGDFWLTHEYRATGNGLEFEWSGYHAPPFAPLVVALGLSDPNATVPGLCAPLRTDALFALPIGVANGLGRFSHPHVTIPWIPALAGVATFNQVASPDASQAALPIALSSAVQIVLPTRPATPGPTNFARTYNMSSHNAATGVAPTNTAVVTRYTY